MTDLFLRVKRDGFWANVEIEHLTDAEREEIFINRPPEELVRWINVLSKQVAKNNMLLEALENLYNEISPKDYPKHTGMTLVYLDNAQKAIQKAK